MVFVQYKRIKMKFVNLPKNENSINEAKYDIGMARKGNGITVYNKAEEENGDYKNVAHIDGKGKIKYYDKKVPSKIKKEIEKKAAEMVELTAEITMKLTDLLNEDVYVKNKETGNVYQVKNANPAKHEPPSKGEIEKAKADDGGDSKEEPKAAKKTNPEKGESLNFVKDTLDSIVPKSEESQKISDDYKKQKAERDAMNAEETAQLDNYLKSKGIEGGRADFSGWDNVEGGFDGWRDSGEFEKAAELRDKLSETSDEFYELEKKKSVQDYYDLTKGSPEELKARHKELDAEVERLQAEQKKAEEAGDEAAAQDAYAAASLLGNKRYAVYAKMNGESDREIFGDMKKDDNQMERIYKDQLKKRNESVSLKKESTSMKLTDLLSEANVQVGRVYSNPYAKSFVKEEEEERPQAEELTSEQRQAFLEAVKGYRTYGESVYRKEGLEKVHESIRSMVEVANRVTLAETGDWFDGVTVSRHMKRMNESFKVFEKTLKEVSTLQQRLESSYDEIGEVLGKYYEISDVESNNVEEGNEFGAARAKAIANGDSEFEVDGKKYPVKGVDKDDKENAKKFANESKSMKLKDLIK